jgi:glycosyltransferase involved in cell wall biosynthesis
MADRAAASPGSDPQPRLHVVVIGPAGRGGIHRMVEVLQAALSTPAYADVSAEFLASHTGSIAAAPFRVAHVIARLAAARPDVAHLNLSIRGSTWRKLVIARACRTLHIPYVIHLHGSNFHTFRDRSSPRMQRAIRSLFAHSARIIVLGKIWKERAEAWAPESKGRIVILPNAVPDPGHRILADRAKVHILFAGRLGQRKGVGELVTALSALRDDPGWHATLAGDGDVVATREAAQQAGIAGRVDIPGWVDPAGMDALMRDADILTLPSFDENLPMSVIEAFAGEVAVVCTPVGAVTDIVRDGETGLLVEPGDAKGLADALRRLIGDADLRHRIARNGRQLFEERLDISIYAKRIVGIWREAASER